MRRLMDMRRLIDRPGRDRGAVALIVAMVVGMFVLTGVAALTIDAGSLYAERRVVQNGADAASLALAQACARGDTTICSGSLNDLTQPSAAKDTLLTLTNLNSPDGLTDIASVCGSNAPFDSCAHPSPLRLVDCTAMPSAFPATVNWVEVRTETRSATANTSVVHKYFGGLADPSYDGVSVKACARAVWGSAGTVIAPIGISLCDYEAMITTTGYADPPPYADSIPTSVTSHEVALVVNDPGQTTDSNNCKRWAGHILPGGFGYLNSSLGCQASVNAGDWVQGKPGASVPAACKSVFDNLPKVVLIPVFDCVSDSTLVCPTATTGANTWYRVKGLAAFYVTGANLPSYKLPPQNAATACRSGKCLYGWFTQATLLDNGYTFDPDTGFGVNVVKVGG
jgi:hypothetical protein